MQLFLLIWVFCSVLWMLITSIIEGSTIKRRGFFPKAEDIPKETGIQFVFFFLRWTLIWPLMIPIVLHAFKKNLTVHELVRVWAEASPKEKEPVHPGKQSSPPQWVKSSESVWTHAVFFPEGSFITHIVQVKPKAVTVQRVGIWVKPKEFMRIEANMPISYEALFLRDAVEYAEMDEDFLYLCNPMRAEQLEKWKKDGVL